MIAKPYSRLVNLNRVLILFLTLAGLLMDGFQIPDFPCAVAVIIWLWLPHCARMEASLLGRVHRNRGQSKSTLTSPFA